MTIGLSMDAPTARAKVQAPQTSKACRGSRRASFSLCHLGRHPAGT